jgi:phosphoribosylformylglycinamidine synthase
MMASIIDEAVRRVISVGGKLGHIAGLDNFCWPDPVQSEKTPDGAYKMAQLVRANQALYDLTTAYLVPCVSGKDSMKNDSVRGGRKISIPPTVLFSTIAKMDDVGKLVTMNFKKPGDRIYVAGLTRAELGASEYHRRLAAEQGIPGSFGGQVPVVRPTESLPLYRAMAAATSAGLVHSSHTPTAGGLAAAFALAAMGGGVGAEIHLASVPVEGRLSDDEILFSESNSRFVLTCAPDKAAEFEAAFAGCALRCVGEVKDGPQLVVKSAAGRAVIDENTEVLRRTFKKTLAGI